MLLRLFKDFLKTSLKHYQNLIKGGENVKLIINYI
jgi:hypothetical protein